MSPDAHYDTFFSRIRQRLAREEDEEAMEDAAAESAHLHPTGFFRRVPIWAWTLIGLFGGMGSGFLFPGLAPIGDGVKTTFGGIASGVPMIIYFTLTPALITMYRTSSAGRFALGVVLAFTATTAAGGLWALALSFGIFRDMTFGFGASGVGAILSELGSRTGGLLFESQPFRAIWGSLFVSALLYFGGGLKHDAPRNAVQRVLWTIADIYEIVGVYGVAALGRLIKVLMPFLLFAIGVFLVITLPAGIQALEDSTDVTLNPGYGAVEGYFVTVGAIVGVTLLWLGIAGFVVARYTRFPFRRILSEYMLVVYPFSWSTSSSAASIPLNLEAARKGLHVRPAVRDFIIPLGATVNLDGTMMSAVITTIVASKMVGYTPSILDLLIALIPLVVITVGTPGVPGGLALVAAPVLASLLPLPPGTEGAFTGIFIAFGFGLNDQFRTAVNTLDNGLLCLLFDKWWPERFDPGATPNPLMGVVESTEGTGVEPSVIEVPSS